MGNLPACSGVLEMIAQQWRVHLLAGPFIAPANTKLIFKLISPKLVQMFAFFEDELFKDECVCAVHHLVAFLCKTYKK